jgi:hypothetical protein
MEHKIRIQCIAGWLKTAPSSSSSIFLLLLLDSSSSPSQAVEKRPSAALSGRLTISAAWQKVAPYSSRRHPLSFLVSKHGVGLLRHTAVGNGFKPFPTKNFGRLASGHF